MMLNRSVQKSVFFSLCALLILLLPAQLHAHAVLVESNPKTGSAVHGPDLPIWLRFNVRVDGSRSRFTLVSADGNSKLITPETQSKPDILTGKLTGLKPGPYRLQWQVLAADGHISQGVVNFTVD
jgi:copper resistance protein C